MTLRPSTRANRGPYPRAVRARHQHDRVIRVRCCPVCAHLAASTLSKAGAGRPLRPSGPCRRGTGSGRRTGCRQAAQPGVRSRARPPEGTGGLGDVRQGAGRCSFLLLFLRSAPLNRQMTGQCWQLDGPRAQMRGHRRPRSQNCGCGQRALTHNEHVGVIGGGWRG